MPFGKLNAASIAGIVITAAIVLYSARMVPFRYTDSGSYHTIMITAKGAVYAWKNVPVTPLFWIRYDE